MTQIEPQILFTFRHPGNQGRAKAHSPRKGAAGGDLGLWKWE